MAERALCGHPTADGSPCEKFPKRGHDKCAAHLGLVGRKPMLSTDRGEETVALVTALLRNGNYVDTACTAAGLSVSAFYAWKERGEADLEAEAETVYANFAEAVARARATGEAALVQEIRQAGQGNERRPGDWRAAAFVLERGFAERWGAKAQVRHSGAVSARTGPPEIPETAERVLTVAALMAEIGALPDGSVVDVRGNGSRG